MEIDKSAISNKLRPKLRRRIKKVTSTDRTEKDALNNSAVHASADSHAMPKEVKIIKRYPKQKCSVEGCNRLAVGSVDICKKHGGDPIIEDNLITPEHMTDMQLYSDYDPAVHPMQYLTLSKEGASEVEIAAELGVSVRVMHKWAETYLDFNTAVEIGNALHEAWWIQEGKRNLDNRGYNTGLFKFITGNKLGYSDKVESKNMHVHAGVLQVPTPMSASEWEAQVEKI